ncbi:hypothetical protein NM208_g12588 [Fusarium decemcellulare]|uniref:Uncharacterized protein n=1 Tax=Fusarium decemcellulare TaxID=57161 RepID=A0ACC1RPE3_9HYPO|nr:hypothetical protein NM208_g12588 [Fusarium decemcellulare]
MTGFHDIARTGSLRVSRCLIIRHCCSCTKLDVSTWEHPESDAECEEVGVFTWQPMRGSHHFWEPSAQAVAIQLPLKGDWCQIERGRPTVVALGCSYPLTQVKTLSSIGLQELGELCWPPSLAETQEEGLKWLPEVKVELESGGCGGAASKWGTRVVNSGPTATSVLNRHAHGGGSHLQQVKSGEGWDGATRLINRTQPREQHTRRGRPIPPPSSKAQFRSASRQAPLLLLLPPIIAIHITVKETEASARQEEKNDKKAFASHLRFFSILSDFCSLAPAKVANLDFEARVPVPFSIFPSTYRESESQTQTVTETHEEVEIKPQQPQAGREGQYSSVSATAEQVPPRGEQRYSEEEVRITREEERYRRPGVQKFEQEQFTIREEHRRYVRFQLLCLRVFVAGNFLFYFLNSRIHNSPRGLRSLAVKPGHARRPLCR